MDKRPATWKELFKGKNGLKAIALAAGVVLHATDVFLATTIMPSVIEDIGGLAFYSLATTVSVVAAIIGSVFSSSNSLKRGPKIRLRGGIISSDESRVGKEWFRTCRFWWWPYY